MTRMIDKMVEQEILACASTMVWDLTQSDCREHFEDEACELWTGPFDDEATEDENEPVYREVFEHWIVTPWLAGHLAATGETVVEFMGFNIWARTTTGQAISMDHVWSPIIKNIEARVA